MLLLGPSEASDAVSISKYRHSGRQVLIWAPNLAYLLENQLVITLLAPYIRPGWQMFTFPSLKDILLGGP